MFNLYPYSDAHELNLDWIIQKIKELGQALTDFEAVNKITNAGAWDITKQYQAWTIVSDNNIGYISLKPVPAGVAITNTEYWGIVADYDILITNLSERISALESSTADLSERISALESSTAELQSEYHHVILYIGDSFTYGATLPGVTLKEPINELLHVETFYNYSYGGTGFVTTSDGLQNSFPDRIELAASQMSEDQRDGVTDILVMGGINDPYTATEGDFINSLGRIINTASASFKNAKLWLVPMLWNNTALTLGDARKYQLLKSVCMTTGCATYPDAYTLLMGYDASVMQDAIHPNATGYRIQANYICDWINGSTNLDERLIYGNDIMTTQNEAINFSTIVRSGFVYGKLFIYTRDVTYLANTTIATLPGIFKTGATRIPINKLITSGTFNGDFYLDGDGNLKATADFGYADATLEIMFPIGYLFA